MWLPVQHEVPHTGRSAQRILVVLASVLLVLGTAVLRLASAGSGFWGSDVLLLHVGTRSPREGLDHIRRHLSRPTVKPHDAPTTVHAAWAAPRAGSNAIGLRVKANGPSTSSSPVSQSLAAPRKGLVLGLSTLFVCLIALLRVSCARLRRADGVLWSMCSFTNGPENGAQPQVCEGLQWSANPLKQLLAAVCTLL